jgi:hypothetical protein
MLPVTGIPSNLSFALPACAGHDKLKRQGNATFRGRGTGGMKAPFNRAVKSETMSRMRHVIRVVSHWGLLLHIYISMAGFTLVLLFAITGLTLNHQDFGWGKPKIATSQIVLPKSLIEHPNSSEIGQHLQKALGIGSAVTDYHEDPDQIQVTFAAPGHRTLATIDRSSGAAEIEAETRGWLGRLDDLHKGFDSGPAWYWIIDITAVLLSISALTGMATLLSLRARRRSGFVVGALGVAMIVAIYLVWVPQ